MSIKMIRSTDRGAPVLSGQQGKMGDLLLAALVEGFPKYTQGVNGANSTSGDHTTVTVHLPAHPFVTGQEVTVSGLDDEYNGNWILSATSTDYIFYVKTGTSSYPSAGSAVVSGEATVGTAVSVTRVGTTVTVVMTGHGFTVGQRAKLLGANQPEYNGWQTIATVADANTFTFELPASATPVTPATGTILVRYGSCALGWSQPYSTTNKRLFKQGAKGVLARHLLYVGEENASYHTYGASMGMVEAATSITAFTGAYYGDVTSVYGGVGKSSTADATARKWVILGDHRTLILLTQPGFGNATISPTGWCPSYFGDIVSYVPGDTAPILSAPTTRGSYSWNSTDYIYGSQIADGGTFIGNVAIRAYAYSASEASNHPLRMRYNHLGQAGYIQPVFMSMMASAYVPNPQNAGSDGRASSAFSGTNYFNYAYPDPVHGGLNIDELHVMHATTTSNSGAAVLRGKARGLHMLLHNRSSLPFANNDTFDGAGVFAGKKFEIFDFTYKPTDFGCFVIEVSDTWSV